MPSKNNSLNSDDLHYNIWWRQSTAGKDACAEIAKTSLIDILLACSIAKSYGFGFAGFGVVPGVFSGRIRPEKMRFGRIAHNLMHYFGLKLFNKRTGLRKMTHDELEKRYEPVRKIAIWEQNKEVEQ